MGKAWHTAHRWDLEWEDDIDILTLGHGVQVKVLYQDSETEHTDMLVKFPAGFAMPPHYHTTNFHRVVVDGELDVTTLSGELLQGRKGDYTRAEAKAIHTAVSATGGTIFIVSDGEFGTVPVDETGNPLAPAGN